MERNLDTETAPGLAAGPPKITTYVPIVRETLDTTVRKWVSYLLLAVLTAVIIAGFTELFLINAEKGVDVDAGPAADATRLMNLMNLVFGPVVTLFSSVVGFYFGARTAKEGATGG